MPAQIKALTHEILEGGAVEVRGPPTNWREGLWRCKGRPPIGGRGCGGPRAAHQLEGGAVEGPPIGGRGCGGPTNWREGLWRAHQLEGGAVEVRGPPTNWREGLWRCKGRPLIGGRGCGGPTNWREGLWRCEGCPTIGGRGYEGERAAQDTAESAIHVPFQKSFAVTSLSKAHRPPPSTEWSSPSHQNPVWDLKVSTADLSSVGSSRYNESWPSRSDESGCGFEAAVTISPQEGSAESADGQRPASAISKSHSQDSTLARWVDSVFG